MKIFRALSGIWALVLAGLFSAASAQALINLPINCASPLSNDPRFGTYMPLSGNLDQDKRKLFNGKQSWLRIRQLALMEETFLHEMKVDFVLDALVLRLKSQHGPLILQNQDPNKTSIQWIIQMINDEKIRIQSAKQILDIKLIRRIFTFEPVKIEFEFQATGEQQASHSTFIFPMEYRDPESENSVAGRTLNRRRLTWGLSDRFRGMWEIELFEFFVQSLANANLFDSKTKAKLLEHSHYPRLAERAAVEYFDRNYPKSLVD